MSKQNWVPTVPVTKSTWDPLQWDPLYMVEIQAQVP